MNCNQHRSKDEKQRSGKYSMLSESISFERYSFHISFRSVYFIDKKQSRELIVSVISTWNCVVCIFLL